MLPLVGYSFDLGPVDGDDHCDRLLGPIPDLSVVPERVFIGVGNMALRFFEDISFSRTNSNGTYRVDL